jgi:ceramide synthetase
MAGAKSLEFATLAACAGALAWCLQDEAAVAELRVLLTGLSTSFERSAAASAALPVGPPNLDRDIPVFRIFVFVFFALNWGLRLLLIEPFIYLTGIVAPPMRAKFAQSVMEAIIYGGFMLVGLSVVSAQEWVWPSALWWKGYMEGGHEIMRSDLRCYYIMYIARYAQAVVSVLIEPKRKDFVEMIVHHVVTVTVICISYMYGFNRVGVVVMVLLDPGDVPLHLAKLCKYIADSKEGSMWQFLADRLFEIFGVVFAVTRIGMYGYVCWSALIESRQFIPKGMAEWTCLALLYTLLVLQFYWFSLIIKVAIKMMRGHSTEDIRSDDEDESAEPTAKKNK